MSEQASTSEMGGSEENKACKLIRELIYVLLKHTPF